MENAVLVPNADGLASLSSGCSRLYFGPEFCQRLLPSESELSAAVQAAENSRMTFTFITPFVTDRGLARLEPLLSLLPKSSEVVVNDWGVLRLLSSSYGFSLSLGRLLTKQQRDPRIPLFFQKLPPAMRSRLQSCAMDSEAYSSFLRDLGVSRVELDPLLHGLDVRFTGLKASLYFPFAFVTATRFCRFASRDKPISFSSIRPCSRLCRSEAFELSHPTLASPLILVGNAQFVKMKSLPKNLTELGIDRLVLQPGLPNQ